MLKGPEDHHGNYAHAKNACAERVIDENRIHSVLSLLRPGKTGLQGDLAAKGFRGIKIASFGVSRSRLSQHFEQASKSGISPKCWI